MRDNKEIQKNRHEELNLQVFELIPDLVNRVQTVLRQVPSEERTLQLPKHVFVLMRAILPIL